MITWDFIMKLPKSKELMTNIEYNLIFVILCKNTKYIYFLPYREVSTEQELVYTFFRNVVS